MTFFEIRSVTAACALALLAGCGASAVPDQTDASRSAALTAAGPAPRADCEADGCGGPRIIDGLAEQYRAAAGAPPDVQAGTPSEAAPR